MYYRSDVHFYNVHFLLLLLLTWPPNCQQIACVAGGFFWCVFSFVIQKVRDSARQKLNGGRKRKMMGEEPRGEGSEKPPVINH